MKKLLQVWYLNKMLGMLFKSKQKEKNNIFPLYIKYAGDMITINNKEEFINFTKHCNEKKTYENITEIKTEE